ncbi:stage II sporulation protein GA (sporulation sigma-E factor processing peptidase) [Virgibacillus natechei]|uniref:Sporulation sigma-E factor-processing peptidase n=1 Tax=Virgibacillus natechei TaxID=1216297 RepID=A0ABS4IB77_9BACI|nr:sigma-E processing peptidase SpoIIGA [Virgibacillus natechei]MBP1968189.1 stage II sporulation protein GA (sporulation sigma-E factor processing peptidase) [Virgibacillus natechei]UZD14538.1 sigma-E processing peptidase SpoIIGA [Virgibacillus natechei]
MTIYLDAVWTLNFFLDMMLLLLTQALARDSTRKIRIIFGAFIASLLVPLSIYFPDSFFNSVIGKFIYSVIIIWSAFGYVSIYRMMKLLLLFYFTSFAIGGGLIAIHFLVQNPIGMSTNGFLTFNGGYGDPISWIFVVIGFPLMWIFTKVRMDKHVGEKIRYDQLYPVTIQLKNKRYTTTGYIDSGNQLVDPITKKAVVICDELFLKQWFTEDEWQLLKSANESLNFDSLPKEWENYIQIVPYQGVQGNNTFLLALRPDQLIVYYENQIISTNKILIGIQFASLTKDRSYHCLLQPQIIKTAAVQSA